LQVGKRKSSAVFHDAATDSKFKKFWQMQTTFHLHGVNQENEKLRDEKKLVHSGVNADMYLGRLGASVSCQKGCKGDQDHTPNQDNFSITQFDNGWYLYCIADGHGMAI